MTDDFDADEDSYLDSTNYIDDGILNRKKVDTSYTTERAFELIKYRTYPPEDVWFENTWGDDVLHILCKLVEYKSEIKEEPELDNAPRPYPTGLNVHKRRGVKYNKTKIIGSSPSSTKVHPKEGT